MSSLVAYYGSSDEEDGDAMDVEPVVGGTSSSGAHSSSTVTGPTLEAPLIKDEDEEYESSILNTEISTLEANSRLKLDAFLPKPKAPMLDNVIHALTDEGPIPPKKVYGDEETPKPSSSFHNIATKKTATGTVQISIPSLKNFADEEEDSSSQRRNFFQGSQKGSGLFALLPQPKHELMSRLGSSSQPNSVKETVKSVSSNPPVKPKVGMIPHSVQQGLAGKRPAVDQKLAQVRAKYMKQESNFRIVSKARTSSNASETKNLQDSDEEESGITDYFSLDGDQFNPADALPPASFVQESSAINIIPHVDYINSNAMEQEPLPTPFEPVAQVEEEPDLVMKYLNPGKKGRGKQAELNIIDVNADDLRPQSQDWLKTITDTSMIPPRKAVLPGGQSKRKHQITYLAAEAKAREEELKNQWAQNRAVRQATQNKYGF